MSLELQLERIANALEKLVDVYVIPPVEAPVKQSAPVSGPVKVSVAPQPVDERTQLLEELKALGYTGLTNANTTTLRKRLAQARGEKESVNEKLAKRDAKAEAKKVVAKSEVEEVTEEDAQATDVPLNETKEYSQCRDALTALANKAGAPKALSVLQNSGCQKLRELGSLDLIVKAKDLALKELELIKGLE